MNKKDFIKQAKHIMDFFSITDNNYGQPERLLYFEKNDKFILRCWDEKIPVSILKRFKQYLIDEGYLGRVFVLSTNINMKHETDFIIPLDYWMARLGYTVKYGGLDIELPYSNDYVEFLKKNKKKNYYACFNGNPVTFRLAIINELSRRGLTDKGIISLLFVGVRRESDNENTMDKIKSKFIDNDIMNIYPYDFEEEFFKNYNFIHDGVFTFQHAETLNKHDGSLAYSGNPDYFGKKDIEETYFWIANETTITHESHSPTFTEKTGKALATVPFISMACPNHIKYIKDMGFETFPEWFDESYDEIPNHSQSVNSYNMPYPVSPINRLLKVMDSVEKVCELSLDDIKIIFPKERNHVMLTM